MLPASVTVRGYQVQRRCIFSVLEQAFKKVLRRVDRCSHPAVNQPLSNVHALVSGHKAKCKRKKICMNGVVLCPHPIAVKVTYRAEEHLLKTCKTCALLFGVLPGITLLAQS